MKIVLSIILLSAAHAFGQGPFQATGFKTGEVTHDSAIVWTRLTKKPERNPPDAPMVKIRYAGGQTDTGKRKIRKAVEAIVYPEGMGVADIRFAVPGAEGQVRVRYRVRGKEAWKETPWGKVDPDADFTKQFRLGGLTSNSDYEVEVAAMGGHTLAGGFKTAPAPDDIAPVSFMVSTGQAFNDRDSDDGYVIYPQILKRAPSFFVHTGDIVYYDRLAKNLDLAKYHWQRTYSLPTNVAFHRQVGSYFIKDDHDAWQNDCWSTMKDRIMHRFTWDQGLRLFPQQVPMGERTYRTIRWGKDLQIWLVEGRDFRSPNPMPDGPDKTIWGAEQLAWFEKTVAASDASFRVLISPTPVVGPDRDNKHDNHSNKNFAHEGNRIRDFMAAQRNMFVVCGDRHWQYHSVDPRTGLHEFSCGPASDAHAGGWKQSDFRKDFHRYLNVIGGFLQVVIDRDAGKPVATANYYDSRGKQRYSFEFSE